MGDTWIVVNNGVPFNQGVTSFTTLGATIFVATWGNGVFRSTDDGQSWVPVNIGLTNLKVLSLATLGTAIFAGNEFGGIHRSMDNGASWTPLKNGLPSDVNGRVFAVGDR